LSTHRSTGGKVQSGTKGRLHRRKFTDILKATRLADLATTLSRVLADRYREAGANHVAVIENHLDPSGMGDLGSGSRHDGVVVAWVAGKEHEADIPHLPVVEALERLLEGHPRVRVVSLGLRLPLDSERYEYRRRVPFGELLGAMRGASTSGSRRSRTRRSTAPGRTSSSRSMAPSALPGWPPRSAPTPRWGSGKAACS
jgi:hypothetical protein